MSKTIKKLKKVSILIPVYNEQSTIKLIIKKVLVADIIDLNLEIIIVDDCSTDSTWAEIQEINQIHDCIIPVKHSSNKGKGAAIRTAIESASGEVVLIQDADLEYDPKDYPALLAPILENKADVVYGSRFRGNYETRVLYFWHRIANGLLTILSNMFTNLNLTDMETGYKVFRKEILSQIELYENRFGVEPEITAKIARLAGIRIYEIGISYSGRTYAEGKKIGLKDAFRAVYAIFKYGLFCGNNEINDRNK